MINNEVNKHNKTLQIIGNVGFVVFVIIMSVLIFITAQSKFTGQEPSLFNHKLYIVDSGSMSPTIKQDSMIIVKELSSQEVEAGDIVTYYGHNKSSRVTHRIMETQNNGEFFITRGDANESDDPLPLEGEKVIGKVVYVIPFIGSIFRFLSTKYGIALLITIAIVWIVLPKFFNKEKEKSNEENNDPI